MAVSYWLKRPHFGVARIRYWIWEKLNPDKPWMCAGSLAFCEANLCKTMSAIEFGSGRSTGWFAERVNHLISVEHNLSWHRKVQQQLSLAGIQNVDYRYVALDHPVADAEQENYLQLPEYVKVADRLPDKSINFAIVDGHYRTTCIRHLQTKIACGGFLLVDDINRWPSLAALPVSSNWRVVDDSTNGVKRCVIWQAE